MKAGAAYLPLDPSHPQSRLDGQLKATQANALLVASGSKTDFAESSPALLHLQADGRLAERATGEPDPATNCDDDLAYVIYTSGSTGQPKPVEITHGALLNLVSWHQAAFQI